MKNEVSSATKMQIFSFFCMEAIFFGHFYFKCDIKKSLMILNKSEQFIAEDFHKTIQILLQGEKTYANSHRKEINQNTL